VRQTKGERNYHIFYNVTNGMPAEEQARYHLHRWDYFDYLNTTGCFSVDGVSEEHEFTGFRVCYVNSLVNFTIHLILTMYFSLSLSLSLSLALSEQDCLRLFSMSEDIIEGIFSIISSVLHLGNVHYVADGDKASYKDARSSMMNEKYSCDKQIPAH
jgi:myosin heavy subunit